MNSIHKLHEVQLETVGQSLQVEPIPKTHSVYKIHALQLSSFYRVSKRGLDICGALLGLLLLLLLLPIIALFIYCEDCGPIFYKQIRVGLYGRPFFTYKLRSMIEQADILLLQHPALLEVWQQHGKLPDDPRITRIGQFLRHSSLDELPQMFNVLRGEMSLVGPRAIQYTECATFGELGALRQQMKPGITGLWQISGRSQTNYEQRCILDCTYVMECSLLADITILLKTVPVVVRGKGAC